MIAGGDERQAALDAIAGARFLDADGAHAVEPLGQRPRESRRQVLHHDQRQRRLGGEARQETAQRRRPARRDAHDHDLGTDEAEAGRRMRGGDARRNSRRPRQLRDRLRLGLRRRRQLGDQRRADARQLGRDLARRLGQKIDGAGGEGLEGLARALARVRRQHHHRRGTRLHDLADRARAVEQRHVEVHGADVGPQRLHLGHGVAPVLGFADDFEARVAGDDLLDGGAHEQRVVADQHSYLRSHCCTARSLRLGATGRLAALGFRLRRPLACVRSLKVAPPLSPL